MKYTPKRYISVIGYSNGRFNEGTTLKETLSLLGVKPDLKQLVLCGSRELDPKKTLKELELYDATLEVK